MGRWGERLFEGDLDLDLESDVHHAIRKKLNAKNVTLTYDDLSELFENMQKPEHQPSTSPVNVQSLRDHLDVMSDELFQDDKKKKDPLFGEYSTCILGAVLMKAGAKISPDNRAHLLQLAQRAESHSGYRLPTADIAFRDLGKAQFIAAVNHYKDGQPHDFHAASCETCGRIGVGLTQPGLLKCGRCKVAWYCNKECQRANWAAHKRICRKDGEPPMMAGGYRMLNV